METAVQKDGPCNACKSGTDACLVPIGKPVVKGSAFATGYERTRFVFAQCGNCGSVWMTYTESGPDRDDAVRVCLTRGWI